MHSALLYELQKAVVEERLRASSSINQQHVRRPKPRFALAIRRRRSRVKLELRSVAAADGVDR
jgi:hypothetical protein